jgi:hypothetical protein
VDCSGQRRRYVSPSGNGKADKPLQLPTASQRTESARGSRERLVEQANHHAHECPLDEFTGSQLHGELSADVKRRAINCYESARHKNPEQEAQANARLEIVSACVALRVDRRKDEDRDEDAKEGEGRMATSFRARPRDS